MRFEDILGNVIAYRSKRRAEINETTNEIIDRTIMGFGYFIEPIARPLERVLDKLYNLFN